MATESHHTSAAPDHEVSEKNGNEEATGQNIVSLSNENENKHYKAEDAQRPATATTLSKTEGQDTKIDGYDSPSLEASLAETPKHDQNQTEDEQGQGLSVPLSGTEPKLNEDDKKAEAATNEVERTDDSAESEAFPADNLKHNKAKAEVDVAEVGKTNDSPAPEPATEDNQKEEKEKEVIPVSSICTSAAESQSQDIQPAESTVENSDLVKKPEKETTETDIISQAPAEEIIETLSNRIEVTPLTESKAKVLEETEYSQASPQNIDKEPDIVATEVKEQDKTEEPEGQEEQLSKVVDAEPLVKTETNEKPSDVIMEKPREAEAEFDADVMKETRKYEAGSTETEKQEPMIAEIKEKPSEKEEKLHEKVELEQEKTVIPETTAETSEKGPDVVEDHTPKESNTDNSEVPAEAEKPESVPIEVGEKPTEQSGAAEEVMEKDKDEKAKQDLAGENASHEETSNDKIEDMISLEEEKTQEVEETMVTESSEQVSLKEEAQAALTNGAEDKPSPDIAENAVEEDKKTQEVEETTVTESSELVSLNEEAQPALANGAEVKSSPEIAENVEDDKKTQEAEETTVTESSDQVSLKEEAQTALANEAKVKSSPGIAENVVKEDERKESSKTDAVEKASKQVALVLDNPERVSINQEAQTDVKENTEDSAPSSVEEKVAVNGDKKEATTTDAVKELLREAEVETKKAEANTVTTEEGNEKVERVKDDQPVVHSEKEGSEETKVNEVTTEISKSTRENLASKFEEKEEESNNTSLENLEKQQNAADSKEDGCTEMKVDEVTAVSEPTRETLASKLEEKEESIKTGGENLEKLRKEDTVKTEVQTPEPLNREGGSIKTSKDLPKETPAKPVHKQSNNIISKVKQSFVKAKKAITGKSLSSKTISSEAKGDIKVK